MEYRFATKDDLPGILTLYKQLNPDEAIISKERAEHLWEQIETNDAIKYFIALDNNRIVSTCNIAIILNLTRNGRPYGIIENVITDRTYQRKGIGKQVIQNAIDYAKKQNCYKILLLSSTKRIDAHNFYESIGFNGDSKRGFEIRFS
ncbi:MAG: GNAT family N-acetyltransferase [Candidatus Vecturithrix sp.]|jgi:GNAT superfamily N-acetyltransferase|nr:GNAT family N-acetyltransferase [Candidatus Vecturithrix sp.]